MNPGDFLTREFQIPECAIGGSADGIDRLLQSAFIPIPVSEYKVRRNILEKVNRFRRLDVAAMED